MKNIAVFASGFGSNFQAIANAIEKKELDARINLLVSDKPLCLAIERAKHLSIDVFSFNAKDYIDKVAYEQEILKILQKKNIDLIVLAGYMRIIGHTLLHGYKGKIINIHPSLLPMYKGKDAIGQAIDDKAKTTGVTVHFVNEALDSGEIISQEAIDISKMSSREEIEHHIHQIEHRLYPKTIKKVLVKIDEKSID